MKEEHCLFHEDKAATRPALLSEAENLSLFSAVSQKWLSKPGGSLAWKMLLSRTRLKSFLRDYLRDVNHEPTASFSGRPWGCWRGLYKGPNG
jgi:hypothetical protein